MLFCRWNNILLNARLMIDLQRVIGLKRFCIPVLKMKMVIFIWWRFPIFDIFGKCCSSVLHIFIFFEVSLLFLLFHFIGGWHCLIRWWRWQRNDTLRKGCWENNVAKIAKQGWLWRRDNITRTIYTQVCFCIQRLNLNFLSFFQIICEINILFLNFICHFLRFPQQWYLKRCP